MFQNKSIHTGIVIFFLLFCSHLSYAQTITLTPEIGYGTYSFSDLKKFHSNLNEQYQFDPKNTDNFPSYFNYGVDVLFFPNEKFGFGLHSSFASTGSKYSLEDYSGFYFNEILANSINLGVMLSKPFNLTDKLRLQIQLKSGVKFSNLTVNEELELISQSFTDVSYDFKSTGFWVQPRVQIERIVFKNVSIGAFAGYEFNPETKITLKENEEIYLQHTSSDRVKISWTGFRVGLTVQIPVYSWVSSEK